MAAPLNRLLPRAALIVSLLTTAGCPQGAGEDDATPTPAPIPEEVEGRVRLRSADLDEPVAGAAVTWGDEQLASDAYGYAGFVVPTQEPFEFRLEAAGAPVHRIQGTVGIAPFQLQIPLGSTAWYESILAQVSLAPDAGRGTLVILLDTLAFQGAIGAAASIDAASDPPFVFIDGTPQSGGELVFDAGRPVVFPNVAPGPVAVSVAPPESESCLAFPGQDPDHDDRSFDVEAGAVTVGDFLCQ